MSTAKKTTKPALAIAEPPKGRTFEERIRHIAVNQLDDMPLSGTLLSAVADLRVAIGAIEGDDGNGTIDDEIVNLLLRVSMRVEAVQEQVHRLELACSKAGSQ